MLIREDFEYTYYSGRGLKQEKTVLRCEVKCDNPECGKTFYRKPNLLKRGVKQHYCNTKCRSTHYGICNVDGCEEKFFNKNNNKHGMCARHLPEKYRINRRHKIFELMGGACVCCGERDLMFLQVDHVFNDGHKERKKSGTRYGNLLKTWNETPERLQLLCANCNYAKRINDGVLYRPEKFTRRKLR